MFKKSVVTFMVLCSFLKVHAGFIPMNQVRVSYVIQDEGARKFLENKHSLFVVPTEIIGGIAVEDGGEQQVDEFRNQIVGAQTRFLFPMTVPLVNDFFLSANEVNDRLRGFKLIVKGQNFNGPVFSEQTLPNIPMVKNGKGLVSICLWLSSEGNNLKVEQQGYYAPIQMQKARRYTKYEEEATQPVKAPVMAQVHPMNFVRASYVITTYNAQQLLLDGKTRKLFAQPIKIRKGLWQDVGKPIDFGTVEAAKEAKEAKEAQLHERKALLEKKLTCFKTLKESVKSKKFRSLQKRGLRFFVRTFETPENSFIDLVLNESPDIPFCEAPMLRFANDSDQALLSLRLEIGAENGNLTFRPLFGYVGLAAKGDSYQKQEVLK